MIGIVRYRSWHYIVTSHLVSLRQKSEITWQEKHFGVFPTLWAAGDWKIITGKNYQFTVNLCLSYSGECVPNQLKPVRDVNFWTIFWELWDCRVWVDCVLSHFCQLILARATQEIGWRLIAATACRKLCFNSDLRACLEMTIRDQSLLHSWVSVRAASLFPLAYVTLQYVHLYVLMWTKQLLVL